MVCVKDIDNGSVSISTSSICTNFSPALDVSSGEKSNMQTFHQLDSTVLLSEVVPAASSNINSYDECGVVCNAVPDATLTSRPCIAIGLEGCGPESEPITRLSFWTVNVLMPGASMNAMDTTTVATTTVPIASGSISTIRTPSTLYQWLFTAQSVAIYLIYQKFIHYWHINIEVFSSIRFSLILPFSLLIDLSEFE
ncbi:unnamed protein product [Adineta ricciae]|uniref:Uncharacterized protein n=1 Tax=Adineta ricciae TaxID=249248 RepID=A0A815EAK1_ADIRI|nr:unnamed protein product [Adineta ricciae]CAF1308984.1 unnamed protein product [Adineta ricciae]